MAWHESGGPLGQQNGGDEGEGQSRHFPEFFIGHIIRGAGHEDSRFLDIKLDSRAWLTCEEGTRVHDIICHPLDIVSDLDQFKSSQQWRIDLWYSEVTFQRMKQSIRQMLQTYEERFSRAQRKKRQRKRRKSGEEVLDTIAASFPSTQSLLPRAYQLQRQPTQPQPQSKRRPEPRGPRGRRETKRPEGRGRNFFGDDLNEAQGHCVAEALKQPILLIQGPPGTGKTRTICHMIRELLDFEATLLTPRRILACAYTNAAADVLLRSLADIGVSALRLGVPSDVNLKQYTLSYAIKENPLMRQKLDELISVASTLKEIRSSDVYSHADDGNLLRTFTNIKDQVQKTCY